MSGGSYDYLCYKDNSDIANEVVNIERMAKRLDELGFPDAAKETLEIIPTINSHKTEIENKVQRLKGVWKAVKWLDSNDSGIEYVNDEIKEYRDLGDGFAKKIPVKGNINSKWQLKWKHNKWVCLLGAILWYIANYINDSQAALICGTVYFVGYLIIQSQEK